jgi:UDP-2-acetamido-3-amino-2,3-dideoxy-glucuronate N-acetyltransferase
VRDHFVHEQAICESSNIGRGSRIWAFAHVLPGARIGEDCNICDHVFIENDVVLGDRVTVKSGVQLWDGVEAGDDVFIGPNATFTNDLFPRSRQYQERVLRTVIESGASIGANSTILPGIRIGAEAMIGAGAVVTHDVPRGAIAVGNPARIAGYVGAGVERTRLTPRAPKPETPGTVNCSVEGVTLHRLPSFRDLRGSLTAGEFHDFLPFVPRRYFMVFDVPNKHVRGAHAHFECHQFLSCISGSCAVVVDDGRSREEILLDDRCIGVYTPPLIWGVQYKYSHDAVLLVLASHEYDANDYIRDYETFLEVRRRFDLQPQGGGGS